MISNRAPIKRKVSIRFMDIGVSIEGSMNVEKRALKILSSLIDSRVRTHEAMIELQPDDDDAELKHKKTSLKENYKLSYIQ